ncbi:MAG TPA: class E sortase [Mycobacteriales bacterium]|nr:class E sortase [Mycobacteriales bacterium]
MQPSFAPPPLAERSRSFGALMGDSLRRPGGRRGVSVLSLVLFIAGIAMFAYPLGTDVYSRFRQDTLMSEFQDPGVIDAYRQRRIKVGQGLTRLKIPKLNVDVLVVEGTTPAALRAGAGHYVGSPLPGEFGNVAIAGHRTTFGRPLNRMDELKPGDEVSLETPIGTYTYRAVLPFGGHSNPWVVPPSDFSVVSQAGTRRALTLTTCHPKGSARQRLVMRFELVKSDLRPLRGVK